MIHIPPQQARNRRCGAESDFDASVVFSCETGLAFPADDVGFYGYAVADLVACDGGMDSDDCACGFVAEDVGVFYYHRTYAAGAPEVDI